MRSSAFATVALVLVLGGVDTTAVNKARLRVYIIVKVGCLIDAGIYWCPTCVFCLL